MNERGKEKKKEKKERKKGRKNLKTFVVNDKQRGNDFLYCWSKLNNRTS